MKNWIITKLVKWLALKDMAHLIHERKLEIQALDERMKAIESMCNIGVDVHVSGGSWAVVCIAGKSEYIKFIEFRNNDSAIRDIKSFLRQYKRSNTVIDSPFIPGRYFAGI